MTKAALTERLANLQSWRYGLDSQISRVDEFLAKHEFLTPELEASLALAKKQVADERVTITFVAETSRGKSELINALFFADLGRRLLPSGFGKTTRCVTELRFNRELKTGLMLLPIETRESPKRLAELLNDEAEWRIVLFDADNPDSVARGLAALSETKRISLADAVAWGLHGEAVAAPTAENESALVDVPRWRYAVINFPHPLLDAGLVIIDTPGLAALSLEPELARERVPDADALVMVLDATDGVSKSDLAVWRDHAGSTGHFRDRVSGPDTEESKQVRMVVLNKIDLLVMPPTTDPQDASRGLLKEIDRRVRETADLLRVDPRRIVAVSARQALVGKFAGDHDQIIKSRLYQLERNLSTSLSPSRQAALTTKIAATLSGMIEAIQASLDQQRFDTLEGLNRLGVIRERNSRLMHTILEQATTRHQQLDAAMKAVRGIKTIQARMGEELAVLVSVTAVRMAADQTKSTMASSLMSVNGAEAVKKYFVLIFEKVMSVEMKMDEIRDLFNSVGVRMYEELGLGKYEIHPFPTHRFHIELQKVMAESDAEFASPAGKGSARRGDALALKFEELVVARVIRVFEIASRESVSWARGLYAALEQPLHAVREKAQQREEGIEQMKAAELDLAERISELQAKMDMLKKKHAALSETRGHLARYLERSESELI